MQEQKKQMGEYDLESAMKRLDDVVARLSKESISLEDSLALYEEGVSLVRVCNERLADAERKIKMLKISDEGEIEETELSAQGEN